MKCRVCSGKNLSLAIDLGLQPWGNHFLKEEEVGNEPFYPLEVVFCHDCQTSQLNYTVKKEVMFSNHTYLSGMTKTLCSHFNETAQLLDTTFFAKKQTKRALDIGSNDGSQLQSYKNLGYDVLGVESSAQTVTIANNAGIPTLHSFFNRETAESLGGKFEVINASGVFFHLEELHSVTDGIKLLLRDDGVFAVQFLYIKNIFENSAFDQIYHEHLLYYSLKTLSHLLGMHQLELFDAYHSPIHGGSIIAYVGHPGKYPRTHRLMNLLKQEIDAKVNDYQTYLDFASSLQEMKERNLVYLAEKKSLGKTIYGMGAPVKGNTLLNYFGIGKQYLDCLVEKNTLRKGLFSPGMHLPILIEDELPSPPDVYYVLAWNFKNEILKRNKVLTDQGIEFYFPVDPKEVPCAVS